jgi:hypothetical protein
VQFRVITDDIIRNELLLVQEGNLARTRFPPQWDDVFRDEIELV